jgi:hypothetical protein
MIGTTPAPNSYVQGPRARTLFVLLLLLAAGCATHPDEIVWDAVPPDAYADYDCDQLAVEIVYIGYRVRHLYDRLLKRRKRDEWQAGMSWFYGATAFFLKGDSEEAAEYQQLRGGFEAARIQALRQQCGFEADAPEQIIDNARAHLAAVERR